MVSGGWKVIRPASEFFRIVSIPLAQLSVQFMSGGLTVDLQVVLLPPLLALGIYVVLSYILLPLWRRFFQRDRQHSIVTYPFARYTPLGGSSPTEAFNEFAARVSALIGRSRRTSAEAEGFLGDEELEEGNLLHGTGEDRMINASNGVNTTSINQGGRRLSRDLERGFIDDSDDEDGDGDSRRIRLG